MAKNWLVAEAAEEIIKGNVEAIQDIGSRFPLFAVAAASMNTTECGAFKILEALPEKVTVRVVEAALKSGKAGADVETESDEAEAPAKAEKPKQEAKAEKAPANEDGDRITGDYENVGAYKLYLECKARGLEVKSKQPKEVYVEALEKDDAANSDDDFDGVDDEENAYDGMTAQELYKECKKRGLKAEAKKPVKYYIDLLEKDDAANADDDEDDWGDDDEDEKPSKNAKAEKSSKSAKAEKPKPSDEDDDDEWDI